MADDPLFQGRGAPLPSYAKRQDDWPVAWRLPDEVFEQEDTGDIFDKVIVLADDVLLRTAVNIWDNSLRAPGSFEAALMGLICAHARMLVGAGTMKVSLEAAADAIREGWLAQARLSQRVMDGGWEAVRTANDEGQG